MSVLWVVQGEGQPLTYAGAGEVLARLGFRDARADWSVARAPGEFPFSCAEAPRWFEESFLNNGYADHEDPESGALIWCEYTDG